MAELKHTANELRQMQSLPLDIKIQMSCRRIKEWYDYYQGDVYISFSGGKDSTVLMDLVKNRCGLKDVPVVFVDTGLEFPEIKEFARRYADVVLRPEKNFKEVLTECGYPVISKEVATTVEGANNYLDGRERERERVS
jgi:3'-phosphoadenosine 5'-phosphosulfate sulfotransferase (PAPS reductase)/FAD synthetase